MVFTVRALAISETLNMQQLFVAGDNWLHELQIFLSMVFGWVNWQFLVGSLIVLLAGEITVNAINQQIGRQRLEFEDGRRRLARVYRASMLEDLDAICSYSRRSSEVAREAVLIIDAKEERQNSSTRQRRLTCPTLPSLVLSNLKGLVETLDGANAEPIVDLLGCYHTQNARLAGALENFNQSDLSRITISKTINFNPIFESTLELYLRAKGMLKFARRRSEEIPARFSADEVVVAMKVLNIDHVMSPEAREYCLRVLSNDKREIRPVSARHDGARARNVPS
jgi:hypothetical protein